MGGCNPLSMFWNSGIATIATASFLFSTGTLGVRFLIDRIGQLTAFQVACVPSFCCSLVCSGVLLGQRQSVLGTTPSHTILNLLRGVFGASQLIFFYIAVGLLPLKDAVTLFFTSPMIAVLLEWMVMRAFPGFKALLGCLLTVAGVVLVTQAKAEDTATANALLALHLPNLPPMPDIGISPGVLCALIAATFNAISFVCVQALAGRTSPIALTWWYHTSVTVGTAIPLALGYPSPPKWPTLLQQGMLVFIVVCQLCGQICLNRGFSLVSATRGAAINVLQVLFSYIWDITILHGTMNATSAAGGAFVMAGVVVVALSGGSSAKVDPKDIVTDNTFARVSFARTSLGRPSLMRKSMPPSISSGVGAEVIVEEIDEPTAEIHVYETPTGPHFQRTSYPPAAAAVGSPGMEVLTSALNLWRKSVPVPEGLLEPLLEDEASSEPAQGANNTNTENGGANGNHGPSAV